MKKKKRGIEIKIKLSNRWLYTLIIIGILLIVGVGVLALGSVPNPGHALSELQTCDEGETLQVVGGRWGCVTASGLWTQSGSNIYYNTGNVGIGITNPSSKLDVAGQVNGQILKITGATVSIEASCSASQLGELRRCTIGNPAVTQRVCVCDQHAGTFLWRDITTTYT